MIYYIILYLYKIFINTVVYNKVIVYVVRKNS